MFLHKAYVKRGYVIKNKGEPAVHDRIVRLMDGELQLFHVRPVQTHLTSFTGQGHQNQARLLPARDHVTILSHHHPVSTEKGKHQSETQRHQQTLWN